MQRLEHLGPQRRNTLFSRPFLAKAPALNPITLRALGRNLRKLIFSYNFVLRLTTITMITVIFATCLKMCRAMQRKQEIPMKCIHLINYVLTSWRKRNWSCISKLKVLIVCLPLHFPEHSKHDHKTLLETVAASFSRGENGINSETIRIESFGATFFFLISESIGLEAK